MKTKRGEKIRVYFDIAFVSLLRKRPDAVEPCDEKLHNDDDMFRIKVINEVGCIPTYWISTMAVNISYDRCTRPIQLRKVHQLIRNPSEIFSSYDPPCIEMQIPVNVVQKLAVDGNKGDFSLIVSYTAEEYQEITNVRGFNLMTLWSNAGGYVGIFLGISLLQVAEVIDNEWKRCWDRFCYIFQNITIGLGFPLYGSK